jgi:hypothetical protein
MAFVQPPVKMKDFAHCRLADAVNECIGRPSPSKERGLQDDKSVGRRRVRLLHGETQSPRAEVAGDYASYRGMHLMQSRVQGSCGSIETCGRSCGTPQTSIRTAPMQAGRTRGTGRHAIRNRRSSAPAPSGAKAQCRGCRGRHGLRGCGKTHCGRKVRPPGLKPTLILWALRGAEAPLFHGTARICQVFRDLLSRGLIRIILVSG